MIYFGNPSTPAIKEAMTRRPDLGAIMTPAQGNRVDGDVRKLIDNGCFTQPEAFSIDGYRRLTAEHPQAVFATVPDAVGDWESTLRMWREFPRHGWAVPLAIVLQDGATIETVPWEEAGAVFVGGTTEWKLGAEARSIVQEANRRGVWAHMGRVNSRQRLRYAEWIGCDSADGTFLVFGPDQNLRRLLRWLDDVNSQPPLFDAALSLSSATD